MLKIRYGLILIGMLLYSAASSAQVSIRIGFPNVSIGINVPVYPQLVIVPGYPVYYAPQLDANYFFYDGMYWVYQEDNWYASSWYNGPWGLVSQDIVPVFVLRIPVGYYRQPPAYFRGWRHDAPPHWGDHWGRDWEGRRSGWDRWNRGSPQDPAPLPTYQRQYSRDKYPHQAEQQEALHKQRYRYQPRDPVVRQHYQAQSAQSAPVQQERSQQKKKEASEVRDSRQAAPPPPRDQSPQKGGKADQRSPPSSPQQARPEGQGNRQAPQSVPDQREQQPPSSQVREEKQRGKDATREPKRGQRKGQEQVQEQEQGRDRNE